MVEVDVALAKLHRARLPQRAQQRCGIIRHARARRRKRREKANLQSFFRGPNNAVPMRTMVAPSSIATSRSCDIPIDNCVKPFASARFRSFAKYGRDGSA